MSERSHTARKWRQREMTVVCAATPGVWMERAKRALNSVREHSPDVDTLLYPYGTSQNRFEGILDAQTRWVLFLDADVLCTGDVRPLVSQARSVGCLIMARRSNLHDHPQWHEGRWLHLLDRYESMQRDIVWNGAMLVDCRAASEWVPRIPVWRKRYLAYDEDIFTRPHKKPDQHSITLALAEAGILDADTCWAGPHAFSWHSRPEELGVIHHFNGRIYRDLEREGAIEAEIDRRREAHAA